MIGKQKLQRLLPGRDQFRGIRVYFHPLIDRMYTGSHQIPGSLHLNDTHTACADLVNFLQITQRRYPDSCKMRRFKNCRACRSGYVKTIDFKINIFHILHPPLLFIDRAETTFFHTSAAFHALILIDHMRLSDRTCDRVVRTSPCT